MDGRMDGVMAWGRYEHQFISFIPAVFPLMISPFFAFVLR